MRENRELKQLNRLRWAIRGVLVLGLLASTAANVLHANPNPISQVISAWPVVALYLTIEVISRVPIRRAGWVRWAGRLVATAVIAGIAAWVSYWHMADVAARYGETGASPYLLPLSVDGLIVVASICLVELGGRIRAAGEAHRDAPGAAAPQLPPTPAAPVFLEPDPAGSELGDPWLYATPIGPEPVSAPPVVDSVSTAKRARVKRQPSLQDRVITAHKRTPAATDAELAARLGCSEKTVQRYRRGQPVDSVSTGRPMKGVGAEFVEPPPRINGRQPELEEATAS